MVCASASGQYIPPFVVMKEQWYNHDYELGMPPETKMRASKMGTTRILFVTHVIVMTVIEQSQCPFAPGMMSVCPRYGGKRTLLHCFGF